MQKLSLHFSVLLGTCVASTSYASDLQIYKQGDTDKGKTVLTLMIDKSGSMKAYDGCSSSIPVQTEQMAYANGTKNITLTYKTCNGKKVYSRMSSVKLGLYTVLTGSTLQDGTYVIGLGAYPSRANSPGVYTGTMLVPAEPLSDAHREKILDAVQTMQPDGVTPIPNAFAEAGAYMMGSTTNTANPGQLSTVKVNEYRQYGRVQAYDNPYTFRSPDGYRLIRCTAPSNYRTFSNAFDADRYYICNTGTIIQTARRRDDLNLSLIGYKSGDFISGSGRYYRLSTTEIADNSSLYDYSGFQFSSSDTKDTSKSSTVYKQGAIPVSACGGGNGIYFMTDGYANAAKRGSNFTPPVVMNNSFGRNANNGLIRSNANETACLGTNLLTGGGNDFFDYGYSGWSCAGEYAKLLRDTLKNPTGIEIKTAAAGYGPAYSVFDDKNGTISVGEEKTVGFNSRNEPIKKFVHNCDRATGDAKNLCKMGERTYNYGNGGFYYLNSPDKVSESIIEFAESLNPENNVRPISTGTFTIPNDPINSNNPRFYAYLPILAPNIGSKSLWQGNLKKYKIVNGAIRGENNNSVVLQESGEFNQNTYDYWNAQNQIDSGFPDRGGSFSRIFHDKNGSGDYEKNRFLFVDDSSKSSGLAKLSVESSKPKGFNDLSGYTLDMKKNILNFLGYEGKKAVEVKDNQELKDLNDSILTFENTNKVHGAVLHSSPQLITGKMVVDPKGKQISRNDYVLYGSFDGALHVLDDVTGDEKFTFIPKHVLENQGSYFNPKATTSPSSVGFGVDGPWRVYSSYKYNLSANSVDITSDQVLAFGGLRMGGSRYYALDLSDLGSPKMLYDVGSNYGANGNGNTTGDFSRMGQSWAKPSIGYIKSGNDKVMVNFLAGGYDMRYEDPSYSASKSAPAIGNAIYAVRVGTVTKGASNAKKIDTANAGQREFWLSQKDSTKNNEHMFNSIVSKVVSFDRDYDGYTDQLYFSDLGGQVFRVDIDNSGASSQVVRVVRVLNVAADKNVTDSKPRFYQAPLVTFVRWQDLSIVGVVSIGSGDLSSPLHERNQDNRIYTFIDKDMASNDLNYMTSSYTLKTKDLTSNNLEELKFNSAGEETSDVKSTMQALSNAKQGWYYRNQHWGNNRSVSIKGLKIITPMSALDKVLFFATFNPHEVSVGAKNACSASVQGASQRETLCLPFGACYKGEDTDGDGSDDTEKKLKYDARPAGAGIVPAVIGYVNSDEKVGGCEGKNCIGIITNAPPPSDDDDDEENPQDRRLNVTKGLFPTTWQTK